MDMIELTRVVSRTQQVTEQPRGKVLCAFSTCMHACVSFDTQLEAADPRVSGPSNHAQGRTKFVPAVT